jgi:hypothetical protein
MHGWLHSALPGGKDRFGSGWMALRGANVMKFYIVTPSFNQLAFLKRCVASVADRSASGL